MRPVGSKYLLEEPLGRGATGTVWRGRQRETAGDEAAVAGHPGEAVAIKILKEELAQDPDVVMRFLRERSVLLRLSRDAHDNIVRTRDLVVEGDLLALVMDLVDGPDLHRHLYENGPFTAVGAALLTAQVADALDAAHGRGVVHRDLKPANVLLARTVPNPEDHGAYPGNHPPPSAAGEQLRPMLTDFGIARLADAPGVTRAHEFVGSPSYVAPESAEGREQTSAVDIYSAGIMLYELTTGEPPFRGGSTLELLQRHLTEQPSRPPQMAEPLWTVIERCLRKNPVDRPSAASLARALRVVAAGISDGASPQEREAALGVAALLHTDGNPVRVAGSGVGPAGAAEPTQAMPGGSASGGVAGAAAAGAAGAGLGAAAGAAAAGGSGEQGMDATRAMPAQEPQSPEDPHPWESQLRAARDRNEATAVQPPVDDEMQDPLYRPPQRPTPQQPPSAGPRRPQRRSSAYEQGYGYQGQQPYYQQYQQPAYPQHYQQPQQPPPYQQPPQQPPYQEPPRQAQQRRQRPAPEPREPRGRGRSANPMRIPGLGCLKGCFVMLLVLAVIGVLLWNFTPLPDWVSEGRGFWDTVTDAWDDFREWL